VGIVLKIELGSGGHGLLLDSACPTVWRSYRYEAGGRRHRFAGRRG
jgi:hypothetical protein